MTVQIFDVEHGACALLTIGSKVMMIDCGHNDTKRWFPGDFLSQYYRPRLDYLAITNCDEDHLSGFPNLSDNVYIETLIRNPTLNQPQICSIKKFGIGPGLQKYLSILPTYNCIPAYGLPSIRAFYNSYPEFADTNNLSLVLSVQVNGLNYLFPGDLEKKGWMALLRQPEFQDVVKNTDILVASHHGRENGVCTELFDDYACHPMFVVISDKSYMYETQETVDFYNSKARGGWYFGKYRKVLTTRNDQRIIFNSHSFDPLLSA